MVTGATGLVVDHALFGGEPLASDVLTPAVRNSLDFLEQLALAPINLGQFITSGSLLAAHSSINVVEIIACMTMKYSSRIPGIVADHTRILRSKL